MVTHGLFFMKKFLTLAFFLGGSALVGGFAVAAQESKPESMQATGNEFAEAYAFSTAEVNVALRNVSTSPIDVDRIEARRVGVTDFKARRLLPGESLTTRIRLPLANSVGRSAFYFDVFGKGDKTPVFSFAVRGFVDWIADPNALKVDLGPIDLQAFERIVPLSLRPGEKLKLTANESDVVHFDVDIVNDGDAIRLVGRSGTAWQAFHEEVRFKTDSKLQPQVLLSIKAQARGPVIPSVDPVDFGLIRVGATSEQIVRLDRLDGKKMELGSVSTEGTPVSVEQEDCVPARKSCQNLRVKLDAIVERGAIFGKVRISLPAFKGDLTIGYSGIAIGKDTQIRDLDEDMKASANQPTSLSSIIRSGIEVRKPLEGAVPDGSGPLIKWQVANEQPIYGYEVYRAESANGPFYRVNERIVAKLAADLDIGSIYRWRDLTAAAGKTYWYYVGTVYSDGRKQVLSTPQKVLAQPK